jgi:flagellar biosynthetic protein FliR
MIHISSNQLIVWLASFIWPLTRILGLIAVAPVYGSSTIPVRLKISFGIVLAIVVAPTLQNLPIVDPISLPGLVILLEQFIIGVAMGFTMQIVFASIDMAGNLISMSMGLGFASFFDPQTHGHTPAVSQFLTLITTMLFLSLNLHLALLGTLVDSFTNLPIGVDLSTQPSLWLHVANAASVIFSSGVQIALPIIAALLVTNIALGILTRAAPQLNIFGIGFPITMTVGFVMLYILMPYLGAPLRKLLELGVQQAGLR